MRIAILGGTGKLGLAFAVRLGRTDHEVAIGSRDAAKAQDAARTVGERVSGMTNADAAEWCGLALASVPYAGHRALFESLRRPLGGKIIVDATVPIDPANMLQIKTDSGKSAAEETAGIVAGADVYAAFQTVSHRVLRQAGVSHDVLVAGGPARKSSVMELVRAMELRPIDAGPIEVAGHIERLTTLLLSINKANKVKESGIRITGI
ncbi:MAG: NAD(P)-binding domain-containing protein [Acidobacteria bacterium]|nr:NAD(P)-binding domain-containing protein [Acidobacteriota bacterium]